MKVRISLFLITCFALFSVTNFVSPYGIEKAEPVAAFLDDMLPKFSPSVGDWEAIDAFPGQTFTDPVVMEQLPEDNGFYIGEKPGRIIRLHEVDGEMRQTECLDISEVVITSGDAGLINFIMHPNFGTQGMIGANHIYIFYAYNPEIATGEVERMNRLARFDVDLNTYQIDLSSEFILIQDYDPQGFHMGGGMFFDNEGFLNLAFGDGGQTNNSLGSTQQITDRFWGGLIRIDIDQDLSRSHLPLREMIEYPGKPDFLPASYTQGYTIPNNNPFNKNDGSVLEEFYALGLRSPHRVTYDPVTEDIWVGDVGEGAQEEITVLKKAGNAQWPFKEGRLEGPKSKPGFLIGDENPPVYVYDRDEGTSVIGGYIYRGEKWKQELDGMYIFGDHGTKNIWSLNPQSNEVTLMTSITEDGEGDKDGIASFATDRSGEVYILKLFGTNKDGGKIFKLKVNEQEEEPIPFWLSEANIFEDLNTLQTRKGIIPYKSINPLWSDAAVKNRWIALPNDGTHDSIDEQITFYENGEWIFPTGTTFIKHFSLPVDKQDPSKLQKIETRLYVVDRNGVGYGLTYRWLDDESDAYLLDEAEQRDLTILNELGETETQTWDYLSRVQCNSCHNANAGYVLGVNTYQMNSTLLYPRSGVSANQLETWNHLNMFEQPLEEMNIAEMKSAVSLYDPLASDEDKVISYLASNCAHCHRPNGVEGAFDARFTTPINQKGLINTFGRSHNSPEGSVIVKPGNRDESQLWIRDASIEENKMPPIAKSVADDKWVEVLGRWIDNLEDPCISHDVADIPFSAESSNGYGPIEYNMSNGEYNPGDGNILTIAGQQFEKGIGTHAPSNVIYDIDQQYAQFNTLIGVDDESCDLASMIFQIKGDGRILYTSQEMKLGEPARSISIDITGISKLELINFTKDGQECDHGNWANAKFLESKDTDGDGVCDSDDICHGADDLVDNDFDGIPDGCDEVIRGGDLTIGVKPNPFNDYFILEVIKPEYLTSRFHLLITDVNGRIFYQDNTLQFNTPYTLGETLPTGVFFVHVKSGSYSGTKKLIKH